MVPSIHRNKIVRARPDKTSVKIYLGTDLIETHPRQPPADATITFASRTTSRAIVESIAVRGGVK
ncbi:MAG: hypothetical protein M3O50_04050, partial [Myxococcota bacterium]|nr:hypothetical protein [Myxococcota bacterium]